MEKNMNIIEKIGDNIEHYMFHYFGKNDMSTGWELQSLIENKEIIIDYYSGKELCINTFDDFIDYLFISKYSKFTEMLEFVIDEKKQIVEDVLNFVIRIKDSYKPKEIITYFTKNYKELFSSKMKGANEELLDIAIKYSSACIEVFDYLINQRFYLILYNFNKLQNFLLKNEELRKALLDENHFNEIKFSGLKSYFIMLKIFIKKDLEKTLIENIIEKIVKYGNETFEKINEDNVLEYDYICKSILDFLIEINHYKANEFDEKYKSLETIKDNYFKKHGQEFSVEIPTKQILQYLNNEDIPWNIRILNMTHVRQNKKFISYYETIGKGKVDSLVDKICSTTTPHDDYFTISKQEHLHIFNQLASIMLSNFLNPDKVKDFIGMIASLVKYDCEEMGLNYENTEFEEDLNILLNMLIVTFQSYKDKNKFLQTGLNYALIVYILGLTEKILYLYYKTNKTDEYMKDDWYTLGDLISENNKEIVGLLGIDHLKVLRYFLLYISNDLGLNLRNKFVHFKSLKKKEIHWGVTLLVFHIFIDIINEMYLKYDIVNIDTK